MQLFNLTVRCYGCTQLQNPSAVEIFKQNRVLTYDVETKLHHVVKKIDEVIIQ